MIEVTESVASNAARLVREWELRGFDAIHLACMEELVSAQAVLRGNLGRRVEDAFVFVTADRRLREAARGEGHAVLDPLEPK